MDFRHGRFPLPGEIGPGSHATRPSA
jgi:hypothetical protein